MVIGLFSFLRRITFSVTLKKQRFFIRRYVTLRHKHLVLLDVSLFVLCRSGSGFPYRGLSEGEVSAAERWDPRLVLDERPET